MIKYNLIIKNGIRKLICDKLSRRFYCPADKIIVIIVKACALNANVDGGCGRRRRRRRQEMANAMNLWAAGDYTLVLYILSAGKRAELTLDHSPGEFISPPLNAWLNGGAKHSS